MGSTTSIPDVMLQYTKLYPKSFVAAMPSPPQAGRSLATPPPTPITRESPPQPKYPSMLPTSSLLGGPPACDIMYIQQHPEASLLRRDISTGIFSNSSLGHFIAT
ncbi:hypothetical protein M426DRAFT_325897 [Hypoxylon sp. CI-4A]|nr:hypothetical protein M426DRAFT_325897 [Hypoxylon sp. CI-4A]